MNRQDTRSVLENARPVIAPSMLKCDFARLADEVAALEAAGAGLVHWDVMDGHFVPNLSYGAMLIERCRELTRLPFEAHLMISEPERYLDGYLHAGCDVVTFHVEAVADPRPLIDRIQKAGALAGLAINPGTPPEPHQSVLSACDLVLVMSVEPGFGGQKFIPSSLEKLSRLRRTLPARTILSIDGGIGPETIGSAAAAGADVFVVGSAIFGHDDYRAAVSTLTGQAGRRN
jgi:ribulose-phosphate 3-epimerase